MKILTISFPRSGTSLTHRILKKHPQIEKGFFETKLLRKYPNKKDLCKKFPHFREGRSCAEKIIYEGVTFGSRTTDTPQMYAKRWNEFFGNNSKIVQIIRHPRDVWNSMILKLFIKRHWEHMMVTRLNNYFDCFAKTLNDIDQYENCLTLKYEDLILGGQPMIDKMYKFCNLTPFKYQEELKKGKVFWYKQIGMRIDTDVRVKEYRKRFNEVFNERLPNLIENLNKFPGVKYEI